jgi:hypothetical protein
MSTSKYTDHQFIAMWCNEGLEYLEDITEVQQEQTWAVLKNEKARELPNLAALKLRAQYNTQRHYEIYIVNASPGITKDDLVAMFEADPQYAADTIRRIGHQYHSDRASNNDRVVIR